MENICLYIITASLVAIAFYLRKSIKVILKREETVIHNITLSVVEDVETKELLNSKKKMFEHWAKMKK